MKRIVCLFLLTSLFYPAIAQETDNLSGQTDQEKFPSENILQLSRSVLNNGEILLINSSHQDLAWMDLLEKSIIERDTMLMTPLLKAASKEPGYRFDIEDVLMIKEYIGRPSILRLQNQPLFLRRQVSFPLILLTSLFRRSKRRRMITVQ